MGKQYIILEVIGRSDRVPDNQGNKPLLPVDSKLGEYMWLHPSRIIDGHRLKRNIREVWLGTQITNEEDGLRMLMRNPPKEPDESKFFTLSWEEWCKGVVYTLRRALDMSNREADDLVNILKVMPRPK